MVPGEEYVIVGPHAEREEYVIAPSRMNIHQLQNLQDLLPSLPGLAIAAAGGAVALGVVLLVVWRIFRRRKPAAIPSGPYLAIDVTALGQEGPPAGPPVLEFYNLPVRVAAVVLAPVGQMRTLPPPAELPKVFDAIVPGLDRVAALHKPEIHGWPTQVSSRGFAQRFFANVRLPGDGGKGTPWSAAAGVIKLRGQPLMVGLVLCAAAPNSFGQTTLDREEKWLGCFRVRHTA